MGIKYLICIETGIIRSLEDWLKHRDTPLNDVDYEEVPEEWFNEQ